MGYHGANFLKSVNLLLLGDFAVFVQVRTAIYTKPSISKE